MLQKIYKLIFLFLTVGILSSCNHKLSYGNYSISLEENDNGFSVKIYDGHTLLASQGKAAIIDVKTPSDDTHASLQYAAAYKSVRKRGDKLIATANIEPIVYLEEAFGTKELNEINDDIETLRKKLKAYGTGGKVLSRNH